MKKILFVIILLILQISQGLCDNNIVFNYDYSVFKGENGKSILEIYYSVSQQSLTYIKTENKYEAAALVQITISDITGSNILFSNVYKSPSVIEDTSKNNNNQKLIGQVNYQLENGKYKLSIMGSDFYDSTKSDQFEQEITVDFAGSGKVMISDIELSTLGLDDNP